MEEGITSHLSISQARFPYFVRYGEAGAIGSPYVGLPGFWIQPEVQPREYSRNIKFY